MDLFTENTWIDSDVYSVVVIVLLLRIKNKVVLKERPKLTSNRYTHTHLTAYVIDLVGDDRNYFYFRLSYFMDTFESQSNRHADELSAKVSRLKHVSHN